MIRVEATEEFSLADFYKIKDSLVRKSRESEGRLYAGDTFLCDPNMLAYLQGENKYKKTVVKVIEVIPEKLPTNQTGEEVTQYEEPKELTAEKPKKTRKRKNK